MRIQAVLKILGILLVTYSFFMLTPIIVSIYYNEPEPYIYLETF